MIALPIKVILWKNLIKRKRCWLLTVCEILLPTLLFLLLAFGRSKVPGINKHAITDAIYFDKYPILYSSPGINLGEVYFYYSPGDSFFEDIIHRVQEKFQILTNNIKRFANEEQLLKDYSKTHANVIAIIFDETEIPHSFKYKIRTNHPYADTHKLYDSIFSFNPYSVPRYSYAGFLTLQQAIDFSYIEKLNKTDSLDVSINLLQFPHPPYNSDNGYKNVFLYGLPILTLLSFIFVCPIVLKRVVDEKYSGIKELMKMNGMKSWMLWFGWFIYSIVPMIFSILLILLILKVDLFQASYPLIEQSSGSVLFVFLLLYCMATITNQFFLSTLFSKPTLATLVGILIWIFSYFIPEYIIESNERLAYTTNMLLMLFPNMALHYGYTAISYYEENEVGINLANVHLSGDGGTSEITMLNVYIMLIIDAIFYMLLTFYIDGVNPGRYGVKKSVFFPFKEIKDRYISFRRRSTSEVNCREMTSFTNDVEEGVNSSDLIQLRNLTKKYGSKKVVNNLSVDIPRQRITVLLGHNGAGKTTTMGILSGMIRKTSGTIIMDANPLNNTIGMCPQHNLFFIDLTVKEHLQFFAMLGGKNLKESESDIEALLNEMNLKEKSDCLPSTLSGGMMRKLCLGMAVIGGSKILILDEPSSGMDPESRRHLWNLLLKWRHRRTIIITTHFMDEADAIGDWIAIMNDGELFCEGTPIDLKKKFETGYNLVLLVKRDHDVGKVVNYVEAKLKCKHKAINGQEIVFLLAFEGNYTKLLEDLERHESIQNISLSTTTLEDVFIRSRIDEIQEIDDKLEQTDFLTRDLIRKKYNSILWNKCKGLICKRSVILSKFPVYIVPIMLSIFFLLLCIYLDNNTDVSVDKGGPPFTFKLSSYGKTGVFLNTTTNTLNLLKMSNLYKQIVSMEKSNFTLTKDVSAAIVAVGEENIVYYRRYLIAAAELIMSNNEKGIEATAMYNSYARHSSPISLNLITNTLAKFFLGEDYSISVTYHPLDNFAHILPGQRSELQIFIIWLVLVPISLYFYMTNFIYLPFSEISTKFAQIQIMTGVSSSFYWIFFYLIDYICYLFHALFMCLLILTWEPFYGAKQFFAVLKIVALYGVPGIPFAYLFSRAKSFSGAYASFLISSIMSSIILTVMIMAAEESGDKDFEYYGFLLKYLFLIICPQFGFTYFGVRLARNIVHIFNIEHMAKENLMAHCIMHPNPCCMNRNSSACEAFNNYTAVSGPEANFMILSAVFFLLMNICQDSYTCKKWWYNFVGFFRTTGRKPSAQDEVTGTNSSDDLNTEITGLSVKKLTKQFSKKVVVSDIAFNLAKGKCLGLLGVNGAGKTTTFRMLTREEIRDKGHIRLENIEIDNDQYPMKLGYCPQNNGLNLSLTGSKILSTMANLRGIGDKQVIEDFLAVFGLSDIADLPCEHYSGGNKRKLSFAVALMGLPEFILLDEPTNGVDPITRRHIWNLIKKISEKKATSFLLTSHSMDECEALCTDITIMKAGTIKRKGTISKLKQDIKGFNVKFKLNPSYCNGVDVVDTANGGSVSSEKGNLRNFEDLKNYLENTYKDGIVRDGHTGYLHYYVNIEDKKWSNIFKNFKKLQEDNPHLIQEFFISDASLEDIFLDIARS